MRLLVDLHLTLARLLIALCTTNLASLFDIFLATYFLRYLSFSHHCTLAAGSSSCTVTCYLICPATHCVCHCSCRDSKNSWHSVCYLIRFLHYMSRARLADRRTQAASSQQQSAAVRVSMSKEILFFLLMGFTSAGCWHLPSYKSKWFLFLLLRSS